MTGVLFQPFRRYDLTLRNRIVMAPMTRGRPMSLDTWLAKRTTAIAQEPAMLARAG